MSEVKPGFFVWLPVGSGELRKYVLVEKPDNTLDWEYQGPVYKEVTEDQAKADSRSIKLYADQFDTCTPFWIAPKDV
jgi:hypothetical protein